MKRPYGPLILAFALLVGALLFAPASGQQGTGSWISVLMGGGAKTQIVQGGNVVGVQAGASNGLVTNGNTKLITLTLSGSAPGGTALTWNSGANTSFDRSGFSAIAVTIESFGTSVTSCSVGSSGTSAGPFVTMPAKDVAISPSTSSYSLGTVNHTYAVDLSAQFVEITINQNQTGGTTTVQIFLIATGSSGLTTGYNPSLSVSTSGGWSTSNAYSLTNTVVAVKSSSGQVGEYIIGNPNSTGEYVQVFNLGTGSVSLGTTMPTASIYVPASTTLVVPCLPGQAFSSAISMAATTLAAGSTAPSTNLSVVALYD